MTRFCWLVAISVSLFSVSTANAAGDGPFFAFTAMGDREAMVVVNRYFKRGDFLNSKIAERFPGLSKRIGRDNLYRLVATLDDVSSLVDEGCSREGGPGLIVYDIEEWDATPVSEKDSPPKSIANGARLVRSSGCHRYATAPARSYLSTLDDTCDAKAGNLLADINWSQVDVLIVQAQGLLRKRCFEQFGVSNYGHYVSAVTKFVKQKNPKIRVIAEYSFRHTSPAIMSASIDSLANIVDAFYLAYPAGQFSQCPYCTAGHLESLLARYRRPINLPAQ